MQDSVSFKKTGIIFFLTIAILIILYLIEKISTEQSNECDDVFSICDHVPFIHTAIPPFIDYLEDFMISKKYHLSFCLIPKVMSTIGSASLCFLENSEKFQRANRTISKEQYSKRFCKSSEVKSYKMVQHVFGGENFENVIMTRNPIDRFVSGFTEKCVNYLELDLCHGCGSDVRCFLQKQYRRLMRIAMLPIPVYTLADTHFAPQTWFCGMENNFKNATIIRYGHGGEQGSIMKKELSAFYRRNGVPEDEIQIVENELGIGKTAHSTIGNTFRKKLEKLIREDEQIRRAILRIYYYDFKILGY